MRNGNFEEINHRAVKEENKRGLNLDQAEIFWIQRLLKRGGGTVQLRFVRQPIRADDGDEIAQDNHQPEKAGENAVELNPFPHGTFTFKIQIERFVVGAISQMMANMSLSAELEGSREKERYDGAGDVVDRFVRMKDIVLGFVAEGIACIHHESIDDGEERDCPPALHLAGCPKQRRTGEDHQGGQSDVQLSRYGIKFRAHALAPGT